MRIIVLMCAVTPLALVNSLSFERQQATSDNVPHGRSGGVAMAYNRSLEIFGGCTSSCCYAPANDVWRFSNGQWVQLVETSPYPNGRVYATAVLSGTQVLLFGGSNVANGFLNDTWALQPPNANTYTAKWSEITSNGHIPPRAAHTAVGFGTAILVYGGRNALNVFSDLWLFDTLQHTWTLLEPCESQKPETGTSCPPGRASHSAVLVTSGGVEYMYVFGGIDALGQVMNDMWRWSKSNGWENVTIATGAPSARQGHAAWAKGQHVYVFGGQLGVGEQAPYDNSTYLYRADSGTWSHVEVSGQAPSARAYAAISEGIAVGCDFTLFGGFSGYEGGLNDRLHNDVWCVQL